MSPSEIIAIVAIAISVIAMIISLITNINNYRTKRYELTSIQRSELISWFSNVSEILVSLRHDIKHLESDDGLLEKLTRLSVLIDQGRFYFPNIINDTNYGKDKPSAFRGHRDVALDLLVLYYDIFRSGNASNHTQHLVYMQKLFTSRVFDVIQPRKFIELTQRYTPLAFDEGFKLSDYLRSEPEMLFSLYASAKVKRRTASRNEKTHN